jgi:hypothetical protein
VPVVIPVVAPGPQPADAPSTHAIAKYDDTHQKRLIRSLPSLAREGRRVMRRGRECEMDINFNHWRLAGRVVRISAVTSLPRSSQ